MSYRPTPETNKLWRETLEWCANRDESHDPQHAALANLSERLERQRDELLEAIKIAADRFDGVKWGCDGDCGTGNIIALLELAAQEAIEGNAIAKVKGTQ